MMMKFWSFVLVGLLLASKSVVAAANDELNTISTEETTTLGLRRRRGEKITDNTRVLQRPFSNPGGGGPPGGGGGGGGPPLAADDAIVLGRIWFDYNANGAMDDGEDGVELVQIKLFREPSHQLVGQTKTLPDSDGYFELVVKSNKISGADGTYFLEVTHKEEGYIFTSGVVDENGFIPLEQIEPGQQYEVNAGLSLDYTVDGDVSFLDQYQSTLIGHQAVDSGTPQLFSYESEEVFFADLPGPKLGIVLVKLYPGGKKPSGEGEYQEPPSSDLLEHQFQAMAWVTNSLETYSLPLKLEGNELVAVLETDDALSLRLTVETQLDIPFYPHIMTDVVSSPDTVLDVIADAVNADVEAELEAAKEYYLQGKEMTKLASDLAQEGSFDAAEDALQQAFGMIDEEIIRIEEAIQILEGSGGGGGRFRRRLSGSPSEYYFSELPSATPSASPSAALTGGPTSFPTKSPISTPPSDAPSAAPTGGPTDFPTKMGLHR